MKTYGKVVDYDGFYGHIRAVDGQNYIVLDKDMVESNLKQSDYVEFVAEQFDTVETNINIARFVKRLDQTKQEEQEKSSYIK